MQHREVRALVQTAALVWCALLAGCSGGGAGPAPSSGQAAGAQEVPLQSLTVGEPQAQDRALEADGAGTGLTQRAGGPAIGPQGFNGRGAFARDLRYHGGPVLASARSYNLYVNCTASCWGSPAVFLQKLADSTMIHILDQYTGTSIGHRYTYGGSVLLTYPARTLAATDIYALVHAAARQYGGGYATMYHVFLPQGTNVCIPSATQCYSPLNAATWKFCGYHGYVGFTDIKHVLFSVEPYQRVSSNRASCIINGPSPNGPLVDSTDSTLEHELFELAVNPDAPVRPGWYSDAYGEIGDLCSPSSGQATGVVGVAGTAYGIQPEYTNAHHRCAFVQ